MSTDSTKPLRHAKVQRSQDGKLLGVGVYIDAQKIAPYVYDNTETLIFSIEQHSDGLFLKIRGDEI